MSDVTSADAGSYTCRAVNSEGEVTSCFSLTVMPRRSGPSESSDVLGFRPIQDDDDSLIDEMI
ncbi:hypothetical protein [Salmonella sp. s55962]|uniref:hypothetical protein n=1 Tax=Salmonella sp. s55962 TaxID=3159685 RepID=UPI00397F6509